MLQPRDFGVFELHVASYAVPAIECEVLELIGEQCRELLFDWRLAVGGVFHLQQQAFLQRACAHACGLEMLEHIEQPLEFGL